MISVWFAGVASAQGFVEDDVAVLWESASAGTYFGWAVADLPDTDGDGIPEVITGDPYSGGTLGVTVLLSGADGSERFRSLGAPGAYEGYAIASAGDIDGDGIADFVSGAPGISAALIYSGATGTLLRTLLGEPGEVFGISVGRAGDINGDGIDDTVVGAEGADGAGTDAGRVVVCSGADGAVIWSADGTAPGVYLGNGTGYLGDVTNDGIPDVAVGARGAGGGIFVLNGVDGSIVYALDAPGINYLGSFFVSGVGDVDGDGVPDVYGGDYANTALGVSTGRVWIWSGATGELLFMFGGRYAGEGVGPGRYAGDVNDDGHADIVVGSYLASSGAPFAGRVTVFSGADGSVLRTVTSTTAGENFGFDTIGLGDVDGDGNIDLLVSAATGNRIYLIGTAQPDTIEATTGDTGAPSVDDTTNTVDDTTDTVDDTEVPAPAETDDPKSGCGCGHTRGLSWAWLLGLVAMRRHIR